MKFSAVVALKLQLKSSTVVICVLYFNEPICLCFWTPRQQLYVMIRDITASYSFLYLYTVITLSMLVYITTALSLCF